MKITNGMSDSAIANELFNRLDALRKARGISQQEMAERIGITRKSYASIGAGTCKFTTLIALLRQLDLLNNVELLASPVGASPMALLQANVKNRGSRRTMRTSVKFPAPPLFNFGDEVAANPILSMRKKHISQR